MHRSPPTRTVLSLPVALAAALSLLPTPAARATLITSVGTLPGDVGSYAVDVNDAGLVAAYSYAPSFDTFFIEGDHHAFTYTAGGSPRPIGTLGGSTSYAMGVNDDGTVVGSATLSPGSSVSHAFRFAGAGPMQDLGTLGGIYTTAYAVNTHGVTVGASIPSGGSDSHPFRYADGGPLQDLGTLGGPGGVAYAVNAGGVIVGTADNASGVARAFRYAGAGPMQDIGTLPGYAGALAFDVNSAGTIVGKAYKGTDPFAGQYHAFRYTAAGVMQDLLPLGGASGASAASGINGAGYVVGTSSTYAGWHAALWLPDNTSVDLDAWLHANDPAAAAHWVLSGAVDINATGLIVGTGKYDGQQRGFVLDASSLTPTPLTGDTNGDGTVDLTDLNNVLNNFGTTATGNPGDDNSDGVVDLSDLNDVLNNFGSSSYAASALDSVPEPASLSLLALTTLPLLTHRRRRPN
jgi:probable HAF family extracellular repeat protein